MQVIARWAGGVPQTIEDPVDEHYHHIHRIVDMKL
jgi:hypothetical protein